jgi:hypothetical protein
VSEIEGAVVNLITVGYAMCILFNRIFLMKMR